MSDGVPANVLEGLTEGWDNYAAKHNLDMSAEEWRGFQRATEKHIEDVETVLNQFTDINRNADADKNQNSETGK